MFLSKYNLFLLINFNNLFHFHVSYARVAATVPSWKSRISGCAPSPGLGLPGTQNVGLPYFCNTELTEVKSELSSLKIVSRMHAISRQKSEKKFLGRGGAQPLPDPSRPQSARSCSRTRAVE